jgi:hypothetical protein
LDKIISLESRRPRGRFVASPAYPASRHFALPDRAPLTVPRESAKGPNLVSTPPSWRVILRALYWHWKLALADRELAALETERRRVDARMRHLLLLRVTALARVREQFARDVPAKSNARGNGYAQRG